MSLNFCRLNDFIVDQLILLKMILVFKRDIGRPLQSLWRALGIRHPSVDFELPSSLSSSVCYVSHMFFSHWWFSARYLSISYFITLDFSCLLDRSTNNVEQVSEF